MSRASDVRSLTQNIAQAHDHRAQAQEESTKRVAEIGNETAALLRNFDKAHSQMGARLKAQLAKEKQDLERAEMARKKVCQADAKQRAAEAKKRAEEVDEIRGEAIALLLSFNEARSEMSTQLKAQLAKEKQQIAMAEMERKKASQAEARERAAEAKERADEVISIRSEARDLVESFGRDSAETAAAWRDLVASMQAKRGVAAPRPVKPPVAAAAEEEMSAQAVPQDKQKLENRILDLIVEHAEGMKLAEMTEATGEARVKLGNITRMLLDAGKIKKEGLLYFPAGRP